MQERVRQVVHDVTTYLAGGSVCSQVCLRLELWRAAGLLIAERAQLGGEPAVVKADMARYVRQGVIDPAVFESAHFHNDALQVLVFGGAPACWHGLGPCSRRWRFSPACCAPALARPARRPWRGRCR